MDEVRISVELPRGVEDAWRALFDPAARRIWWGRRVDLPEERGGGFIEYWRDGEGHERSSRGEVLELRRPELLRLSWLDDDWPEPTSVELRLEPGKQGSHLELVHSGFEKLGPKLLYNLEEYQHGWEALLDDLRTYLAGRAEELDADAADDDEPTESEDAAESEAEETASDAGEPS